MHLRSDIVYDDSAEYDLGKDNRSPGQLCAVWWGSLCAVWWGPRLCRSILAKYKSPSTYLSTFAQDHTYAHVRPHTCTHVRTDALAHA